MKLQHRILGWVVYAVIWLISLLPLTVSQAIGRLIGRLSWAFKTRAARITQANLALCMPELSEHERDQLARESLVQTGQQLMETPASWLGRKQRILRWIRATTNHEALEAAIAADQGAIILMPHIGNFELINVFMAQHERQKEFVGLYAPPNQDYLKKLISTVRLRFGNELVPTTVKGIATLLKRIRAGKLILLLPDQVPATGEFVPFFGEDALTDVIAVRMLEKSPGARVFTCAIERLPDAKGFVIHFDDAHPDIYSSDRATALRGLNASVEACVRRFPAQYQWEYKRFKQRPAGKPRLYNFRNEPPMHH